MTIQPTSKHVLDLNLREGPSIIPDPLRLVWKRVDELPEPKRARWQCALMLAWNEGARMNEVAYASDADFDLGAPDWSRPIHSADRRRGTQRFEVAPETRDSVAAVAALGHGVGFVLRQPPASALRTFRRLAEQAGLPDFHFASIRRWAMARDFHDARMIDAEFYARYPVARRLLSPRDIYYGQTRHERGF